MNNPVRTQQIRKATLSALAMSGNYALPIDTLWGFVGDLVKPPLQFTEKGVTEKWLTDGDYIRFIPNTLDPGLKQCVITELGKNLLASL